ncbi:unnamed protein product, partial [Callosobruchus maculatus]
IPLFYTVVVHFGGNIPYFWIILSINSSTSRLPSQAIVKYCRPGDEVAVPLWFQRYRRLETAAPRSDGTAAAP